VVFCNTSEGFAEKLGIIAAMNRKILAVGNCTFDHVSLTRLLREKIRAEVVAVHSHKQAVDALRDDQFAVVLVNRKLHADHSDGIDLIRQIKSDSQLAATPVILLSNYRESQQQAVEAGAEPGFGKDDLYRPEVWERLRAFLA
jgi:CheY-like chemotaxis protein